MNNEQFVGTWNLVSFEAQPSAREKMYPLGPDADGILIYEANGYFSAQVMQRDRPNFTSGDMQNGTVDEISSAYKGYIAYYGDYVIDESEGIITHLVRGSLFPNFIGDDQTRYFKFSGNQLTLSTPPIAFGGQTFAATLIWEKAP